MSLVLTLVAQRDATTLDAATIALACEVMEATENATLLSPEEAVDIPCPATATERLPALRAALEGRAIDAVLTHQASRRKRLLVSDMDSTIVANETLDDLATHAGIGEKIAAITTRSMNGEMDFATALRERVALLKGFPASLLEKAWKDVTLNEGAKTLVQTMRTHGTHTALVSGGFTFFTSRVAGLCGFDEDHANTLLVDDAQGILTGETGHPVLGPETKLALLDRLAAKHGIPTAETLAIGDGANDLPMLKKAGLGLAFHAKPVVRKAIAAQINQTSLRTALFAQGYPATAFSGT
ncbi:phosphoserine phosphatase [Acetobacter orleanensis NRIC 0473]|uniref:Phosphoserine phosphatase n=2 Tax=Acetobacter orleanensis TaxID=104099 RepID=A0A4Y3TN91_9PROT|nr:phosphoserine phosphatase [Acetobacter orleanensis]PCD80166.1 phosphoserine phosphatase SerB [Acetobacter orleanensis]GAN68208.1 phosphoserine phosphatase [Acetobacter orleanensis JCM 7639]GBR31403.1 phosphoserine phosphatase [Acetobacter orleanensis NRIC 0473]GEB82899.1 phosphoserine phosphatase SerB [Acetobacter orleanensis]